jgi:hypothetical protein
MAFSPLTGAFRFLACSLLVCASVACGPSATFGQATNSPSALTQDGKPGSGMLQSSEQTPDNPDRLYAQEAGLQFARVCPRDPDGSLAIRARTESGSSRRCSSAQLKMGAADLGSHWSLDRKGGPTG